MLGLAPGTARAARPAIELTIRPAGLAPGSLAAVDAVAAIHRVTGACHVIVAPLVAEQSLADWWERSRRVASARVNANVVGGVLNRAVANVRLGAVRTVCFGREEPRPAAATAGGSGGGEFCWATRYPSG